MNGGGVRKTYFAGLVLGDFVLSVLFAGFTLAVCATCLGNVDLNARIRVSESSVLVWSCVRHSSASFPDFCPGEFDDGFPRILSDGNNPSRPGKLGVCHNPSLAKGGRISIVCHIACSGETSNPLHISFCVAIHPGKGLEG